MSNDEATNYHIYMSKATVKLPNAITLNGYALLECYLDQN